MDLGFSAAGFETAVCVEIDADACGTLRANGRINVLQADLLETRSAEIMAEAGVSKGDVHALIGGPPCQPFSKSGHWARGKTLRLADPRAATLEAFMRVWMETLPHTVVLENVPGFLRRNADDAINLVLGQIAETNAREGTAYEAHFRVLNAAEFGVPQMRKRFFLVASRDGRPFEFPKPTFGSLERSNLEKPALCIEPYRTAWDAIGDLKSVPQENLELTGRWAKLLPSIPEGTNYLHHTDRGCGLPLFGWRRRYWSFLLKLAKDKPAWTIQAEPGPATGPFHWLNRRLSIREISRLQTFPDRHSFCGSDRSTRRQVGNAVPPLLAEVIAREVGIQFLNSSPYASPPTLLRPCQDAIPPPEPVVAVPKEFLPLLNSDDVHPGTGQGRSASMRGQHQAKDERGALPDIARLMH
ncbi:MAG: DNA cytosine methyltransferase [Chloroflexi bacterium]|nr:DNA cytosine methyltransferase [Chloroflexota bacterium]MYC01572.1 DNA cytosine methyltransferase [Chloroflexota bacterium]